MPLKGLRVHWLGGVLAAAATAALALALAIPAQAQRGFFDGFFGPYPSRPPVYSSPDRTPDASRAPPPRKAETPPTSTILVLGDSTADWLAYGLEEALADAPEFGVIRKNRTFGGLIRYDARNEQLDWLQVAREAIAAEKPNYIVMMIGVYDRQSIRERQPATRSAPGVPAASAPSTPSPSTPQAADQNPEHDGEAVVQAEPQPRSRGAGVHEYKSERWVELYTKRIDDMIAALKSRGVPVLWVGLPAVRGTRSTSDMQYLNELFRNRAEKAGIVFVDVWDGFVDENNRFVSQGPDFEGQTRRLRTGDGVHFTKAGARKLAHYVEREIKRVSLRGPTPIALPASEPQPQAPARPSGPTQRPLAGPVMPLTSQASADQGLLGGGNAPAAAHVTATRVLVKGEAVSPPAGRGDDFTWPRRSVAPFGTDPVVATTTLPLPVMQAPAPATTVSAPAETPAVAAAVAPRRSAPRQAEREHRRSGSPFGFFFPFFR
jgi:hypothetical protein